MKSVMHNKEDHTCFLCILLNHDESKKDVLQEHHVIYGNGRRLLSEKFGLKVYLCLEHHLYGPNAVHLNHDISDILAQAAEVIFIKQYSMEEWMKTFNKNYLPDGYAIQDKKEIHESNIKAELQWIDEEQNL